jgi:HSP20 family protein
MLMRASVRRMPMDAHRHGDSFLVHFDLPGVDPASIELTIEKNVLTGKGRVDIAAGRGRGGRASSTHTQPSSLPRRGPRH